MTLWLDRALSGSDRRKMWLALGLMLLSTTVAMLAVIRAMEGRNPYLVIAAAFLAAFLALPFADRAGRVIDADRAERDG